MKLKEALINIFLAGCFVLTVTGAWDYAKSVVRLRREKAKAEELAAMGFDDNGAISALKEKKLISAVMAIAGYTGLFIFIYKSSRNKKIS